MMTSKLRAKVVDPYISPVKSSIIGAFFSFLIVVFFVSAAGAGGTCAYAVKQEVSNFKEICRETNKAAYCFAAAAVKKVELMAKCQAKKAKCLTALRSKRSGTLVEFEWRGYWLSCPFVRSH